MCTHDIYVNTFDKKIFYIINLHTQNRCEFCLRNRRFRWSMRSKVKRPGRGSGQACRPRRCCGRMTFSLNTLTGHYFILKFDLSSGIRTNMGKPEGMFLNLQCDCHRVASIFIKLINQRTNFITWLPDLTALGINGISLNSQAHIFSILRTGLINKSP